MVADVAGRDPEFGRDVGALVGVGLGVVVVNPDRARIAFPQFVQPLGRRPHAGTIAAGLAEKQHCREAAAPEAASGVDEQIDESILRQGDGARLAHVSPDRLPAALRHIGDDRSHQCPSQCPCDAFGRMFHDELVFAVHHVRAFLFGSRCADDDRARAGLDHVAHLGPRQIVKEHLVRCRAAGQRGRQVPGLLRNQLGRGLHKDLLRAERDGQQGKSGNQDQTTHGAPSLTGCGCGANPAHCRGKGVCSNLGTRRAVSVYILGHSSNSGTVRVGGGRPTP